MPYKSERIKIEGTQYDREVLKTIISKYNLIWMEFNHKCFMWDLDDNQVGIECPYSLTTTDIVNQLYRALNK